MIGFIKTAKFALLGVALFGFTPVTGAFAQGRMPPEVTISIGAVNHLIGEVDNYVTELAAKCDKCDASAKTGSKRAVAALRKAVADLEKITSKKIDDIVKAAK